MCVEVYNVRLPLHIDCIYAEPVVSFWGVLAVLVYLGWLLNDGFCLLSQLEHRLCGSTCLGARLKRVSRLERVVLVTSLCARVLLA